MVDQKTLSTSFSTLLFLSCLIFVISRAFKVFQKYFQKIESFNISYDFIGNLPFPSITLCPDAPNQVESALSLNLLFQAVTTLYSHVWSAKRKVRYRLNHGLSTFSKQEIFGNPFYKFKL